MSGRGSNGRRLRGVLAALLLAVGLVAVAAPGAGAVPSYNLVEPGGSLILCVDCADGTGMSVDPPGAGVLGFDGPSLVFTAAADYRGPAVLRWSSGFGGYVVDVLVAGQDDGVSVQGSFVVVPAPGPCLLLVGDDAIDFGALRPGSAWTTAPIGPNLLGCGEAGSVQDVLVHATDAVSASGSLSVDGCLATDFPGCAPDPTGFGVAVPSASLVLRSQPAELYPNLPGDFTQRAVDLAVRMPSTMDPFLMDEPFTFDVLFTAVAG